MDKLIGGLFEGGAITDENRWIAYVVLFVCVAALAAIPFRNMIRPPRRKRRHRKML